MNDYEVFKQWLGDVMDLIYGQPKLPVHGMMKKDIGQYIGLDRPKRARGPKGRYKGDDKSTKDVNEAWVGGKAPKKTRKKK